MTDPCRSSSSHSIASRRRTGRPRRQRRLPRRPRGRVPDAARPERLGQDDDADADRGLRLASRGEIRIRGASVVARPPHHRDIGMVFQSYALSPAHDTVPPFRCARGRRRAAIESRVRQVLDIVRLPGVEKRYPRQLSGGQQQRACARARRRVSPIAPPDGRAARGARPKAS